ncbi:uncharacterized protein PSFLO_00628 [Pseudozyma flocculosa]|uniref:F-box domain-containing protein n=2 Tax=Pseudozyma flocculosa TaxID=84751 RepID=A0A5C3EUJ8_9BASI|nr:uncharacterized protein PSFLO_00628 [Pseudozyma flocculosa]
MDAATWPAAHGGPHHAANLLSVPPEILDNIACFAAVASTSPPGTVYDASGSQSTADQGTAKVPRRGMLYDSSIRPSSVITPPNDLRSLLLVCRRFHHLLNIAANPRLYARVFRSKFDTAAIERRFGKHAVSSANLAQELRRRCLVLRRMRRCVENQELCPGGVSEETYPILVENLWTAYMMLLENDGLNLQQLKWGQIESYLAIHHAKVMLSDAVRPGYPADSVDRALALHITYLLTDPEQLASESKDESEEKLFVLRPFVFAAHKFTAMLAPWTMRNLPLDRYPDSAYEGQGTGPNQRPNPFLADLTPRARACEIDHCGQRIRIAIPVLSHGALFSFFMKVEKDPAVLGMGALLGQTDDLGADPTGGGGAPAAGQGDANGMGRRVRARSSRSPLSLSSLDHDRDVLRLLLCADPHTSPGLSPLNCSGMFEGTWEGRFSFFDFDSYREMLAGRMRSLYEGPFGEQPQIWKIREKIVRLGPGEVPGGKGSVLGAGYMPHPEGIILDEKVEESIGADSVVVDRSELLDGKGKGKVRWNGDKGGAGGTTSTTAGLPVDWSSYPRFDDEEDGRGGTRQHQQQQQQYEILLSGTGHSAWGRFVLRGRVRTWDGMLIMTKEYRPDGRGRWLYRGYVVAGGKLVGRWRDTFTPENMSGYEG